MGGLLYSAEGLYSISKCEDAARICESLPGKIPKSE